MFWRSTPVTRSILGMIVTSTMEVYRRVDIFHICFADGEAAIVSRQVPLRYIGRFTRCLVNPCSITRPESAMTTMVWSFALKR